MGFMQKFDRKRVRASFGKQARDYESHASVQKRVLVGFMDILMRERISPRRLLDIGSGTGMLLRSLREVYRDACAVGVDLAPGMSRKARESLKTDMHTHLLTADAEHLPFHYSSFDLVVSTSAFQWLNELDVAFSEAFRVLSPGGVFCFALFGEKTLYELKSSFRRAIAEMGQSGVDRTHDFFSRKDVEAALNRSGFTDTRVTSHLEQDLHVDVAALLRSLKRIGAGNASPNSPRGLSGKRVMHDMVEKYRASYGTDGGIPATYEILYGIGKKSA
jgi:malonyl-CoA O-methyltransferase